MEGPVIRVEKVEKDTVLAGEMLRFAEECSWYEAKEHIAYVLRKWLFTDWETMFAAVCGGRIVGMASIMKTDYYPLPDIYPWISGIYVSEAYRGNRISGMMIGYAERYAKAIGFTRAYIPSGCRGLYEKYGYTFLRDIVNYGGDTDHLYFKELGGE